MCMRTAERTPPVRDAVAAWPAQGDPRAPAYAWAQATPGTQEPRGSWRTQPTPDQQQLPQPQSHADGAEQTHPAPLAARAASSTDPNQPWASSTSAGARRTGGRASHSRPARIFPQAIPPTVPHPSPAPACFDGRSIDRTPGSPRQQGELVPPRVPGLGRAQRSQGQEPT